LSEEEITTTNPSQRKIPHWHGREEYVADNCYRILQVFIVILVEQRIPVIEITAENVERK
jgi:hypothetical protein